MNAICFPSGAHVMSCPRSGSGALELATGATTAAPDPLGCTTHRPFWSPSAPSYAIHFPSGDQCGDAPEACALPARVDFCVAISATQSWVYGRPGWSRMATV